MDYKKVIVVGPSKGDSKPPYFFFFYRPGRYFKVGSHEAADAVVAAARAKGYHVRDDRQEFAGNVWD